MSEAFPQISKQYIRYGVTNEWYSCNKTFFFRTFWAFSIIPIPLEIVFLIVISLLIPHSDWLIWTSFSEWYLYYIIHIIYSANMFVCLSICVCVFICMCVCVSVCVCLCVSPYMCMSVCMFVCLYVYVPVYLSTYQLSIVNHAAKPMAYLNQKMPVDVSSWIVFKQF